jgi:hypothetical protein
LTPPAAPCLRDEFPAEQQKVTFFLKQKLGHSMMAIVDHDASRGVAMDRREAGMQSA